MKNKTLVFVCMMLLLLSGRVRASDLSSSTIAGASEPDRTPAWYAMDWVTNSKFSPEFEVLDTESALGRYAPMTKTITLKDLVKFHGHACDGLIQAAAAIRLALNELFPKGIIDRTDLRILSKNSPCFVDASAYLTGGRINFGTLDLDNKLGASWIVQRISDGSAVKVSRRPGVFPHDLAELEKKVRSGKATPEEITRTRDLAWAFSKDLLSHPLSESFAVEKLSSFKFPASVYPKVGDRGDVKHKNDPY
ncbi:MAG: formylmethanofuran dehydrogenase subunit E family protein [Deltaproteobacteria bacterium]